MSAIQLDLTQLPPTARRQPIEVLHRPELIATFIRRHQWTDSSDSIAAKALPKSMVRVYELTCPNGEALVAGYGIVVLPSNKTVHRLLIVRCWGSELRQTEVGLGRITASYPEQLAGLPVAADIRFTTVSDPEN